MVSASRDGGILAGILEQFGVKPVRGSSSRRGPQALLEMTTWAERGYDLAITPDGPRGPRYKVQEGVISAAQLTGLPIVPVGVSSQLENPREELGPVSNSAAVRALRSHRRQDPASAARDGRRRNARNCGSSSKPKCAPSRAIETMIARVSLEIALRKEFDYSIPPGLAGQVEVGSHVQVPFGPRKILGCVTALAEESAHANLKPILKVIGAQTLVTPKVLKLARWIGEYYCCAPETALQIRFARSRAQGGMPAGASGCSSARCRRLVNFRNCRNASRKSGTSLRSGASCRCKSWSNWPKPPPPPSANSKTAA